MEEVFVGAGGGGENILDEIKRLLFWWRINSFGLA